VIKFVRFVLLQAFCIYRRPVSDVEVSPAVTSDHTVDILTEQISCSSLLDKAEFTLEKPLSLSYRCDYEDVYPGSGPAVKSTEFVLETYSKYSNFFLPLYYMFILSSGLKFENHNYSFSICPVIICLLN